MDLAKLLRDLSRPEAFPRHGRDVQVVQTHASAVFLTGDRAYKVKKPVALWGLIDYSTHEKRLHACREEVRVSGRFAPEVYLGVLPVVLRGGFYAVGGKGDLVDHAVEMVRIPVGATLKERVLAGTATEEAVGAVAEMLVRCHAIAHDCGDSWRTQEFHREAFASVLARNLEAARSAVPAVFPAGLHGWFTPRILALLAASGRIRRDRISLVVDGHGDLRAEHVVLLDTPSGPRWRAIDAIEFSTDLRVVDPLSDAAFLAMDLAALGRRDLSRAFLDAFLGDPPDPDAPALLPLFLAYRAHVRALVDAVRASEEEVPASERERARGLARRKLALAWSYAREGAPPLLVVLSGAAGTGKSAFARGVATTLDADVVSSDVVRKGLAGLSPTARVGGADLAALYGREASRRTYDALVAEAEKRLRGGRSVLLDATFLRRQDRWRALNAARRAGAVGVVLRFHLPEEVASERIAARAQAGTDPSDATVEVHAAQVREEEPISDEERPVSVERDGRSDPDATLMLVLDAYAAGAAGAAGAGGPSA